MSNSQHCNKTIPPRQFNFPQLQRSRLCGRRRRRSCTCLISGRIFHSSTRPQSCRAEHESQGSALMEWHQTGWRAALRLAAGLLWDEVSAVHIPTAQHCPGSPRQDSSSPLKHGVRLLGASGNPKCGRETAWKALGGTHQALPSEVEALSIQASELTAAPTHRPALLTGCRSPCTASCYTSSSIYLPLGFAGAVHDAGSISSPWFGPIRSLEQAELWWSHCSLPGKPAVSPKSAVPPVRNVPTSKTLSPFRASKN